MLFGVVGDIHGDFVALERAMRANPDVPFWLCVGDVADGEGRYPAPIAPLYWIKGNNEDFDLVERAQTESIAENLHLLPNGRLMEIGALKVAGLGGTFAPTWYERRASELGPVRPGSRDDKRRHFVREEVEACKAMADVDVFLTHEAPRPFFVETPASGARRPARTMDAGKTPLNEVLSAMQPRLHFFGHHHRYTDAVRQGVRSIGLDLVSRSYVLVDAGSFDLERRTLE